MVWIQIRPNILSILIWVQPVLKLVKDINRQQKSQLSIECQLKALKITHLSTHIWDPPPPPPPSCGQTKLWSKTADQIWKQSGIKFNGLLSDTLMRYFKFQAH